MTPSSDAPIGPGLVTLLALLVVAALLGRGLRRSCGGGSGSRADDLVLDLVGGLLALHLSLLLLHGLRIRWTPTSVALALALAVSGALALHLRRSRPIEGLGSAGGEAASDGRSGGERRWSSADGVTAMAVLVFAAAAWTLRATHPDFIYHWGIKGRKFLLAGGPDFTYLSHPWNHFIHPDYPRLIPELYAVTSLPAGRFSEPVLLLWSVVFFAVLLVALRQALERGGVASGTRRAVLAFLALGLGAFAIGHRLAGGADLPLALALAVALPVLLAPTLRPADDLTLGLAAAFAAASKIEGVPLAGALIALQLWRRYRDRRLGGPSIARIVLPPALVVLPWLVLNLRHGLFQATNSGALEPERWLAVLTALGDALAVPHWHGLSWLILGTPLLLANRRARGVAVVVLVQLAFYLWIFFTQIGDPELLVRFSFPRLLLPLVPAVIVAGAVTLAPPRSNGALSG